MNLWTVTDKWLILLIQHKTLNKQIQCEMTFILRTSINCSKNDDHWEITQQYEVAMVLAHCTLNYWKKHTNQVSSRSDMRWRLCTGWTSRGQANTCLAIQTYTMADPIIRRPIFDGHMYISISSFSYKIFFRFNDHFLLLIWPFPNEWMNEWINGVLWPVDNNGHFGRNYV